jgi:hypothetical protein
MKKTDRVPAMLTPKEAVLNRNAAELLGRDAIKRLNAHGNMLAKRGVDLASDPTPGPSTQNLLGYQMGTAMVGRDDRTDLLQNVEDTFYGGGQVPVPTPTPTPTTRMYQYGTEDVRRRTTDRYYRGINISRGPSRNAITDTGQGEIVRSKGLGPSYYSPYGSQGLSPENNPAYQAALARNPTPASRYAERRNQPFTPTMVGKYESPYGQRAVVSSGPNTFRTYDRQGGYIGRTGNATDYLNKQFGAVPMNQSTAPVAPVPNVVTTPTSVAVNTGQQFQPYNLEQNPFTGTSNLTLEQPRRYSDYY